MSILGGIENASTFDRKVYKRVFKKSDGRDLLLFGYEAHELEPLDEDVSEIAKGGELRWHPFRQEWNIYAAHRQNRTFKPSAADDPLAPSQPNGPKTEIPFNDFELAVFENKFTSLHEHAPALVESEFFTGGQALGRCEVIVFDPENDGNLWSIGQSKRRLLVEAWIDRYRHLYDAGAKFVLPFENRGDEVGVTLHHPHGQIYSFPFVPSVQARAAQTFRNGYDLSSELDRINPDYGICEAQGLTAFCPPYARFPYEVWIVPNKRRAGPWCFSGEERDGFATLLGDICRRYDTLFGQRMPYMLSLHAAPAGEESTFHFTAQFYPLLRAKGRVKYLASVEQSTGTFTIDVMPELAAKQLRELNQ